MTGVCRRVGMSRQNYYAQRRKRGEKELAEERVVELVQEERRVQPRLGTRKLLVVLKEKLAEGGLRVGRDRLFRVLQKRGLLVPRREAEYPSTTNSRHVLPLFRNEVKGKKRSGVNEVWVSDLTYLRTREGFVYLALVTDQASRKIVGYQCGKSLESSLCVGALEMAVKGLKAGEGPIHHSDRGTQYCSHEYVGRLRAHGLKVSMTEENHCAENALAERMNGILKGEYGLGRELLNLKQAEAMVAAGIWQYNHRRPHGSLGLRYPAEVYAEGGVPEVGVAPVAWAPRRTIRGANQGSTAASNRRLPRRRPHVPPPHTSSST